MVDPDMGAWTYWVDPLGQTYKQLDAKSQTTTFTFDALGRVTKRLEPDMCPRVPACCGTSLTA